MKRLFLFLLCLFLMAASPPSFSKKEIKEAILELHKSSNGKYFLWNECGDKLNGDDRERRSDEYAEAILWSQQRVQDVTGEWIDPRYVIAILYRESSHNECVVGKKETDILKQQVGRIDKKKLINHIQRWVDVRKKSYQWCKKNKISFADYMDVNFPEYKGIRGWDIGAAQFRYPSIESKKRSVVLSDGKVIDKVELQDLFDYRVSIQLLTEDLASHKVVCRNHRHFITNKSGVVIKRLSIEDAYFAHHHTGSYAWSQKYWKRIKRHLLIIDKVKSLAIAHLFSEFNFSKTFLN